MRDVQELFQYKSTQRLLLAAWVLLTFAVFAAISLLVLKPTNASPTNQLSTKCTTSAESISISGNTATGKFTVPSGCPGTHVLLASYTAPNGTDGKPYTAQKLHASSRALFGPGKHTLTVQLPNCYYQVDLARGTVLPNFNSTTYTASTKHILLAAKHGGTQSCEQKPAPTPPAVTKPTPPEQPKPQPIAPTQQQSQSQSTVVNNTVVPANADIKQSDSYTPPETTTLPDTGASANALIATFVSVSSLSSIMYYAVTSRLFAQNAQQQKYLVRKYQKLFSDYHHSGYTYAGQILPQPRPLQSKNLLPAVHKNYRHQVTY